MCRVLDFKTRMSLTVHVMSLCLDPQFLVAEEDIVEVGPEELQGTTRLFQLPHSSASQPKEVIFVDSSLDGVHFYA